MAKKHAENYLDFVPVPNPRNTWSEEDGIVTIHMVHRGFYDRLAQKLFHPPPVSHIKLDEYGSVLWLRIDGEKSVGALAEALREEYGEAAEPLYLRGYEGYDSRQLAKMAHLEPMGDGSYVLFDYKNRDAMFGNAKAFHLTAEQVERR